MRQIVELQTSVGCRVSIVLDHWGSGLDDLMRRWVLVDGCWKCTDGGDFAEECRSGGVKVFRTPHPVLGIR